MFEFIAAVADFVARLIATLLAILCIALIVVVLVWRSAETTLIEPRVYKRALALNDVYREVPRLAATHSEAIANELGMPAGRVFDALASLDADTRLEVFNRLLPPSETRPLVEAVFDDAFAWLNQDQDTVEIPFQDLKANLEGRAGEEVARALLFAHADCLRRPQVAEAAPEPAVAAAEQEAPVETTEPEAAGLDAEAEPGATQPAPCALPVEIMEVIARDLPANARRHLVGGADLKGVLDQFAPRLVSQAHAALKVPVRALPDTWQVIAPDGAGHLREDFAQVRDWARYAPLLPFGLLLLITILAVRSVRGACAWWGVPLLLGGGAAFLVGLLARPVYDEVWLIYAIPRLPAALPADVIALGHTIGGFLVEESTRGLTFEAVLVFFAGLAAVVLAVVLPDERRKT